MYESAFGLPFGFDMDAESGALFMSEKVSKSCWCPYLNPIRADTSDRFQKGMSTMDAVVDTSRVDPMLPRNAAEVFPRHRDCSALTYA
jgi:hypothetical protein